MNTPEPVTVDVGLIGGDDFLDWHEEEEDELLYFLSKDLEVAVKAVDSPDQILTELMLMAKKS